MKKSSNETTTKLWILIWNGLKKQQILKLIQINLEQENYGCSFEIDSEKTTNSYLKIKIQPIWKNQTNFLGKFKYPLSIYN